MKTLNEKDAAQLKAALAKVRTFLLDMDGTFYLGGQLIEGSLDFIKKVLNKITLFGAIFLSIVAVAPIVISHFSDAAARAGISLGGTSIIIVVGVALETVKAIEAQMLMRHYKGFLD